MISITDPVVINFFNSNPEYDPNVFMRTCVEFELERREGEDEATTAAIEEKRIKKGKKQYEIGEFRDASVPDFNKIIADCNDLHNMKETLKNTIKQQYKENLRSLDLFKYKYIGKYLAVNRRTVIPTEFRCNICNIAQYSTKKALASHKRTCAAEEEDDDEIIEEE